mgnify:FL=1
MGEQQLLDLGEEVFEESMPIVERLIKNQNEVQSLLMQKRILQKELKEAKDIAAQKTAR